MVLESVCAKPQPETHPAGGREYADFEKRGQEENDVQKPKTGRVNAPHKNGFASRSHTATTPIRRAVAETTATMPRIKRPCPPIDTRETRPIRRMSGCHRLLASQCPADIGCHWLLVSQCPVGIGCHWLLASQCPVDLGCHRLLPSASARLASGATGCSSASSPTAVTTSTPTPHTTVPRTSRRLPDRS